MLGDIRRQSSGANAAAFAAVKESVSSPDCIGCRR
jgi:hypothetical protein